MPCVTVQGREIDCRDSVGGVAEVYIANFADKATLTASSGTVTAHTLSSGKKYWTYKLEKENAEFTEVENVSVENGTLYYETTLTFSIPKMSASFRNSLNILAQQRLLIIIKDNNGKYWLMGQENGADKMGSNEAKSGKAFGDRNGYTLSFVSKEANPMNEVSSSLITALTTA